MKEDRKVYEYLSIKKPDCFQPTGTNQMLVQQIESVFESSKEVISNQNIKYATTWVLDRDLWLQYEQNECEVISETLSRGRIVLVNPGVSGVGREQRYMHNYIILGEHNETFIGVPVTNMACNGKTGKYYLRNYFEVELIEPETEKAYTEYRCSKPSVADIRNISGLDKRRIIKNDLFYDKKYVPDTYLNAISEKIRDSIAIFI